ncbi:MAG: hypothetical protein IPJ30_10615 [Acidobacteria bacterium]|nr:hypothetical protein [Acidobacteriota bacterium]
MPDGSKHQLYHEASNMNENEYTNIWPDGRPACSGSPLTGTLNYFTADGTFLRLALVTDNDQDWTNNAWTLYSPEGTRVVHDSSLNVYQRIIDRNGNYVDVVENAADSNYSGRKTTYIQDQLSRKVVIDYAAGENEDWIRSTGFNGEAVITKVKWKSITVNKEYWSSDMAPSPLDPDAFQSRELAQGFVVVDRIDLPAQLGSGLHYVFGYNADNTSAADNGWGELSSVELPSGASADYDYYLDGSSGTGVKAEKVLRNRPIEKTLEYDLEYDDSTSGTSDIWTYSAVSFNDTLEDITSVTVTGPDGAETTEHYYQGGITNPPYVPVLVKGESYKTVTPTSILEKIYTSNIPAAHGFFNKANRWVKYEFTTIEDNSGSPAKTAITEYSRDKNGNVTEVRQYDFAAYSTVPRDSEGRPTGLPSGATPARITKTDYYNDTPDSSSTTYTDSDSYHLASSPRLLGLVKSTEIRTDLDRPNREARSPTITLRIRRTPSAAIPSAQRAGTRSRAERRAPTATR